MPNEDETVWTTFNGEIYNHHELRSSLQDHSHRFKGRSDTEVLPHLYEENGPAFAAKLRGMFAVAIYDTRSKTLTLARDRFGIKPLFYAITRERIVFASEIRALLGLPGVDGRPDRQAVYDLAALYYIPAPKTFYSGIQALQPGEILEATLDARGVTWKTSTYHRWAIAPNPALTLADAAARAEELVTAGVRRQLESDVPLGALLSGGIDSSLVSVAAQNALHGKLRTFNVRFSGSEYDETWAALLVAKQIRSSHLTLDMDHVEGSWEYVTGILRHVGQPFADTSIFAVNGICQLMRKHVTVALSGDGGDEAFGGYSLYWRISRIAEAQRLPSIVWRTAASGLKAFAPMGFVPARLPERLIELAEADDTAVVQSMFCELNDRLHRNLCHDENMLPIRRWFERRWDHQIPPRSSRLERLSAHATEVNTRLQLANDFLLKVDTAGMKESLEVRVPMLDEDLFAFGLTLPYGLKVSGREGKRILRTVAQRTLPAEVANKPKHGFNTPVDSWVDAEFKSRLRQTLLGQTSKLPEFFRPTFYYPLVTAFCDGRTYPGFSRQGLSRFAIMLLSVQLALEEKFSQADAATSGSIDEPLKEPRLCVGSR